LAAQRPRLRIKKVFCCFFTKKQYFLHSHHDFFFRAAGMTPFGAKLRTIRAGRQITLRAMAAALDISPAYLSALEHGRRGAPSPGLIYQICEKFGLIWDDAHDLADLARVSKPKLRLDSAGLTPEQTALANRFARQLRHLPQETVAAIETLLRDSNQRSQDQLPRSRAARKAVN
jgi:transcriptional regulator with XRE-family HTH domain